MTRLGKILVAFNLVFSLSLMIWAMHGFVNRTDWSDKPAKDGKPAGKYFENLANVRKAWGPMAYSERDWRTTRVALLDLEQRRRDTSRWYEAHMARLDNDPDPKNPRKMRELEYDKAEGMVIVLTDPKNQAKAQENDKDANKDEKHPDWDPKFQRAFRLKMAWAFDREAPKVMNQKNPLVARNVYEAEEVDLFGTDVNPGLLQYRTNHRLAVEKSVEQVTKMVGPKGLHNRLKEEVLKRDGIVSEAKMVVPLLVNTAASSQFAVEREAELRARLDELEKRRDELRRKLGIAGD